MALQFPRDADDAASLAKYWVLAQGVSARCVFRALSSRPFFCEMDGGWAEHAESSLAIPPTIDAGPRTLEPEASVMLALACCVVEGVGPVTAMGLAATFPGALGDGVKSAVEELMFCVPAISACLVTVMHPTLTEELSVYGRNLSLAHGALHVENTLRQQLCRVLHVHTQRDSDDVVAAVQQAQCTLVPTRSDRPIVAYAGNCFFACSYRDHVLLVLMLARMRSRVVGKFIAALQKGVGARKFWERMDALWVERAATNHAI